MKINTAFTGANSDVVGVVDHMAYVRPQLRDTTSDWFYWAFCVEGAQNETWTFDFCGKPYLGYYGPAVSHDLKNWHWAGAEVLEHSSRFTYTFGPDEICVYFAHNMLYLPDRFQRFAVTEGLALRTLTHTRKNNPVVMAEIGSQPNCLILTARHHCCESTGSYVLEGMLQTLRQEPIPGLRVIAVPFIDLDGVLAGDQGKNRFPHDHNRDYIPEPIYAATAALMAYTQNLNVKYLLDLHSPWHLGGRNDTCFIVHAASEMSGRYQKLGCFLQNLTEQDPNSMRYQTVNDIEVDVAWNSSASPTCSKYYSRSNTIELSLTFETMYFGTADNPVSQKRLLRLGANLADAIRAYDREKAGFQSDA